MSTCIRPGEITDDDLIAHAAGESDRRVRDHVRSCPRCADRAADYAADAAHLTASLYRVDCPPSLALGEYQLGQLDGPAATDLRAHLLLCPHCTAELATAAGWLDGPLGTTQAVPPPTPTPTARVARAARTALREIIAILQPPRPMLSLRSGGRRPPTLIYTAEDLTLTLHPQAADKPRSHFQVLGFVEQQDAALDSLDGARARLRDATGTVAATEAVDAIGSFSLGPVPPGTYRLEVASRDRLLVVPALQLPPERQGGQPAY